MSGEIVLFRRTGLDFALVPEATELRERALVKSSLIGAVTDAETNKEATEAMQALQEVLSAAERQRKELKKPIWDAGVALDKAVKDFVEELVAERDRVSLAAADYQQGQLRKQREIEEKRRLESERIDRERREAEEKILAERRKAEADALAKVAEERRKAEEQASLKAVIEARNANTSKERALVEERAKADKDRIALEAALKTKADNERILRETEAKMAVEAQRAGQQQEMLPVVPDSRAKGQRVVPEYDYEVVDKWLLARMHPGFVTIEPSRQEIRDALARGVRDIKGLRIFEVVKVGVRASGRTLEAELVTT